MMQNNRRKFFFLFLILNLIFMLFYVLYYKIENPSIFKKSVSEKIDSNSQDMATMISEYMKRLKKDPKDIQTLKSLGTIFMQMRAWDKAIFFWKRAVSIRPKDMEVLTNLSTCYFFLKKYKEATVYLKRLIQIDPDNYMAKFNLAYLYGYVLNKKKDAKRIFSQIILSKDAPENLRQDAKNMLKKLTTNNVKGPEKEKTK